MNDSKIMDIDTYCRTFAKYDFYPENFTEWELANALADKPVYLIDVDGKRYECQLCDKFIHKSHIARHEWSKEHNKRENAKGYLRALINKGNINEAIKQYHHIKAMIDGTLPRI
mgnify:CR=1 FL=1